MATYLVTYDLNKEIKRPPIVEKVKSFPGYAMLSESSYAISTPLTVEQVYEAFKPLLDDDDTIYIISLRKPWTGFGLKDVNQWLADNLPNS
jgi:uncharacterized membrane protein